MALGEKRKGAGRPAGTTAKDALSVQVAVRVTPAEKKLLEEFAGKEGVTVSKYIHKRLFG